MEITDAMARRMDRDYSHSPDNGSDRHQIIAMTDGTDGNEPVPFGNGVSLSKIP
jgi:hypothetical protein